MDTTEILDESLSVYSHYLIDWQAYGSLNWSRTSGTQTATLSANVQVSCDAPGNNHGVKAMLSLYQNGDSFSLQLVITDSLGYTYTRTLDRLIVENGGTQLTSDPSLDRNAGMQVSAPSSGT